MEWKGLMDRLIRWTRRVIGGGRRRAAVEIRDRAGERPGLVVEVPIGACPAVEADELRLSDRLTVARIREVVAFAGPRCPVAAWRLHGVDRRSWTCDEAARWVATLAEDAGEGASIVIVAGDMPTSWRRRFVARVARHTEPTDAARRRVMPSAGRLNETDIRERSDHGDRDDSEPRE